jgi:hypothetical protein
MLPVQIEELAERWTLFDRWQYWLLDISIHFISNVEKMGQRRAKRLLEAHLVRCQVKLLDPL